MKYKQLKADLINVYNQQAEERDKREIDDWKAEERAHFLSLLQDENKQTLLEIGAGPGRDSLFFKEQGLQITCVDLSPKMIELCQQKGLDAHVMDMVNLDFEQDSFDAVYALNSFLHLPKDKFPVALENVRNVLQPAGLFYFGSYGGIEFEGTNEKDPYRPMRFFSFHSDENLKRILAEKFNVQYFKRIDFGEEQLSFQSVILKKQAGDKQ
jgi:SAM-dependent methyltransferase